MILLYGAAGDRKGVSLPKLYHCGGKLDPYRSQFLRTRDYFAALPEGSIDYFMMRERVDIQKSLCLPICSILYIIIFHNDIL